MADTIRTTYKDYEIVYSEFNDQWTATDTGLHAPSLSKLKDKLDDYDKQMRRINIPVLFGNYDTEGTATLLDGTMVWVTPIDTRYGRGRRKVGQRTAYPLEVEANKQARTKIAELREQQNKLANEIAQVQRSMVSLDQFLANKQTEKAAAPTNLEKSKKNNKTKPVSAPANDEATPPSAS